MKVKAVEKLLKFDKNTAVQITCYDRNGNEVKRVTSSLTPTTTKGLRLRAHPF